MKWRIKNTVNSTRLKLVKWYENDSLSFKPEVAELVPVGYFPLLTYEKFVLQSIINNPYALAILAKESSKGCSFWQGKRRLRAQFAEMIELVVISLVQSTPYYSLDLLKCVHINLGIFFTLRRLITWIQQMIYKAGHGNPVWWKWMSWHLNKREAYKIWN